MNQYLDILLEVSLFRNINRSDIESLIQCLSARISNYKKDDIIFRIGDQVSMVGIVLEGGVQVVRDDLFGNRTILTTLAAGDIFGETFACAGVKILPVSVLTTADSKVLLMDYRRIITTCSSSCIFHQLLVENMLQILAQKNLMLNQKIDVISARTTRDKLMVYLTALSQKEKNNCFDIPYNRQGLADFLSVDRSAMSSELGKMRDEGILKFHKNHFEIIQK